MYRNRNMTDEKFMLNFSDGVIKEAPAVCIRWTDQLKVFRLTDGPFKGGIVNLDWSEYLDQFLLGTIKHIPRHSA